jgi:hypothetical protein
MKPQERRRQTATQVKGLSPEKVYVGEADSVHGLEGSKAQGAKVSRARLVRGLRPWYGVERVLHELGRPARLPEKDTGRQSERGEKALKAARESDRPIV